MGNEMISAGGEMTQTTTGTIAVQQSRAMAMTLAKMQIAMMSPRDVQKSLERIKVACMRPKLAEVATYNYSRGGTEITGPSIRLAEVIAQNWKHIDCGIKELERRDGESTALAYAMDLETNYTNEKEFQVPHVIFTKHGAKRLVDDRDIYEKVANQGARRLRACILAVIPKDIVDEAVATCEETLKANCEITKERLDVMVQKFAEFDVTQEMIEKRIHRSLTAITPAQFLDLGKKYNALKDGMAKVEDFFTKDEEPAKEAKPAGEGEPKKDLKSALGISGATWATGSAEAAAEPEKKGEGAEAAAAPSVDGEPAKKPAMKPAPAHKCATGASGQMKMAF